MEAAIRVLAPQIGDTRPRNATYRIEVDFPGGIRHIADPPGHY